MVKQPERLDRWARLVLQVVLGVVFAAHGAQKLFLGAFGGGGIHGTVGYFGKLGLVPSLFWAWVVIVDEFIGGLCVLFGFLTRFWASLIVIEMIVATVTVNWARGLLSPQIGWEVPLVYGATALALALMGPSFLSVDRAIGLEKRAP